MAEVETFPRDKVLQHLESISGDLAIQYLEYIIEELHDESPEFHNRLVIAYLDKIKSDKKKQGKEESQQEENKRSNLTVSPPENKDQELKSDLRSRLISFLTDSSHYKAERILSRLPIDGILPTNF